VTVIEYLELYAFPLLIRQHRNTFNAKAETRNKKASNYFSNTDWCGSLPVYFHLFSLRFLTEQLQMAHKKCCACSVPQGKNTTSTSQLTKGGKPSQGNAPPTPSPKKKTSVAPHGKMVDDGGILGPLGGGSSSKVSPRRSTIITGNSLKNSGGDLLEGKSGNAGGRVGDKDDKKKGSNMLTVPSMNKGGSIVGTPGPITQLTAEDMKNSESL